MKSVVISIQPKWSELIASGRKTIEVRKNAPKEVPFKAYIYQTKKRWIYKLLPWIKERQAKVIGEFICDKVEGYNTSWIDGEDRLKKATCLDDVEILEYMNNYTDRKFYGWHITDLKIYEKPKELWDFRKPCSLTCADYSNKKGDCETCGELQVITRPPQSWYYVEEV